MGNTQPPKEIIWEAPSPRPGRKPSKWEPVAVALRSRPGQWACIGRNVNTGIMTMINKSQLRCFKPEGAFEATARNHTDRWTGDVYARYIGDHGEYA